MKITKALLRNHIERIQRALASVPLGQDGSGAMTASISGMKLAQGDIRRFNLCFQAYVLALQDNDIDCMLVWLEQMEKLGK